MSQLNISTLANLAGSETTPIADVINGSARAFVNFNGTGTVAIRASYNVSSITDNGTGDYTVTFSSALPDVNYCFQMSGRSTVAKGELYTGVKHDQAPTTTTLRVLSLSGSTVIFRDADNYCLAIFR